VTKDDAKRLATLLGKLFPSQLTPELYRFVADGLSQFDVGDAEKAIKSHRAAREFVAPNELFEGCRAAANARVKVSETTRKEGTWADVFRRQRPDLAKASDYEVVLRIHRGWWFKCSKSDGYRRQIDHSCTSLLIRFGMEQAAAEQWAATVFEEGPEFFRQCLEEIRSAAADPAQMALM